MTYEMKECVIEGLPPPYHMAAYTPDGHYIGSEDWAQELERRGIVPTIRKEQSEVCSIGFCEREQKWYGWSHRAMFGFGIGSSVKKGDCAYSPTDAEDFREDTQRFWGEGVSADHHVWTRAEHAEEDGVKGVRVTWLYTDDVPNESIRGTEGGSFFPYPITYGRGEWTAETLDDAKQMACDFAEGVG